ncbi:MAG: 6,7-dimethyl-8-ribityllumazine synthase [Candidatus Falkowbacteria bacterium]
MNRKKTAAKAVNHQKANIAIVISQFNIDITGGMLNGAKAVLATNKVEAKNITEVYVPGAIEIPLACARLAKSKKYDGIVALGCVIKGDTDHYYYVAGESIRGVMEVMLKYELPVGLGIITVNNLKQAKERSGTKNNKGGEAAQAVLDMLV